MSDPDFALLLDERIAQATRQQASLRTAIDDMREARSLTFADDEHDPEGSTVSLDQARDTALLARTEQTLGQLADARARLTAGTFGRCLVCGSSIPLERLVARPEASTCVGCVRPDRRSR